MDKKLIKKQQKELRDIFNEWDFIGGVPLDEYDCIVGLTLSSLLRGIPLIDLEKFIADEITSHFGMEVDKNDIQKNSEKIFNWFNKINK